MSGLLRARASGRLRGMKRRTHVIFAILFALSLLGACIENRLAIQNGRGTVDLDDDAAIISVETEVESVDAGGEGPDATAGEE